MKMPLLISVPHAGLVIPDEVRDRYLPEEAQTSADSDGGASRIYDFESAVRHWVSTDVARAVVDLNRAEDDRNRDGVVKTHTIWEVLVYRKPLGEPLVQGLLEKYYRPYHRRLSECAADVVLGVDCHTMAGHGPPVGPDPGAERPPVTLSNADRTCPREWLESLAACFEASFGTEVALNTPFRGGHIVQSHAHEAPWVQLEISRAAFASDDEKRTAVLAALRAWCEHRLAASFG